ncbi:MAG: sialate O-acetylesterase [Ruminococcaceae bacterium]|nr:sialate O-acetylesterase [Oscillospiraceae bacterium]
MSKNLQRMISFVLAVCLLISVVCLNNTVSVIGAEVKSSVASAFQNAQGATTEGFKYNFDSDAVGTNLVTGQTRFMDKISTDVGNSASSMTVTSSKTAKFEGFTQFFTDNRWACASSISFDLKMASSSEDFSGFYIKFGDEIPSGRAKNIVFYSNDGVRSDSANSTTGTTGIGFSFRTINSKTCIEIFVKYLDSAGNLCVSSQYFYDAVSNLYSFNTYKITDDCAGNINLYVNGNLLVKFTCSDLKVPTLNSAYREKYYSTVKMTDKNNTTLAVVSNALVSAESALAFATRNETLEIDNIEILDTGEYKLGIDSAFVTLSKDISLNFVVLKERFEKEGYTNPVLKVSFDGSDYTLNPSVTDVDGFAAYVFSFDNITPQMMNDLMTLVLSADLKGEIKQSEAREYSVAMYFYSQLESTTSPKLRRLLVDVLKYGSAAQVLTNHKKTELADADLTATQLSWGTQQVRDFEDSSDILPLEGKEAETAWVKMGLEIKGLVSIAGSFKANTVSGLSVKVADSEGNVIYVIPENKLSSTVNSDGTYNVSFVYDKITASQMSSIFSFEVCDASGKIISDTYLYSIESRVSQSQESANVELLNFLNMMMLYGDSAYNYLTAVEEPPVTEEKAKVILICGQSNAAGVSPIMYIESAVGSKRAQTLMSGIKNVKIVYNVSTTGSEINKNETLEIVKAGQGWHNNKQYFGPELGLAEYLSETYPDEKFYIVKHAIGSSTIGDYMPNDPISDFVSGVTDTVKYNSYGELKRVFDVAVPQIKADSGLNPEVVGVCWVQGESEAAMGDAFANTYKARQEKLISNFRRDYAAYAPSNGIAFFDATIASTVAPGSSTPVWPLYKKINDAKQQIAAADSMCYIVDVNSNGIGCTGVPDYYHYDAASMIKLGRFFGTMVVQAINTK